MFRLIDLVETLTLGQHLRNLRKGAKQTIMDVTAATGINASNLSYFETGKREPSITMLKVLAKHYNTTLAAIFTRLDE